MGLPSHPARAVSSYHLCLCDFLRKQLLVNLLSAFGRLCLKVGGAQVSRAASVKRWAVVSLAAISDGTVQDVHALREQGRNKRIIFRVGLGQCSLYEVGQAYRA